MEVAAKPPASRLPQIMACNDSNPRLPIAKVLHEHAGTCRWRAAGAFRLWLRMHRPCARKAFATFA